MAREDPEALRRRLYAPGASETDIDRYRAAGGGSDPVEVEGPAAPPRARRRPPLRLVLVVAAVVIAVVAGGVVASRLAAPSGPTAVPPTPMALSAADRNSLEASLAAGNYAGIAAYLVTHRALPQLDGATNAGTIERKGVGDGLVTLAPVSAAAVSGRATVLLVLAESGNATRTTLRRTIDSTGEERYVRQVRRGGVQAAGALTQHTFRYASGDRPIELQVHAPMGVAWGVVVLFTD